jgi:hypothetical protein
MQQHASTELSRLTTPAAYQAARGHIFPSATSLQWFMRRHRDALLKDHAVLKPAGRFLIDAEAFDKAVIRIGHQTLIAEAA